MDFIRGLAILFVILHHAEGQIRGNLGEYPQVLLVINDVAAPYRMPLLMMLSGFMLSTSLAKPAGAYIRGKLTRIAWPYFMWSFALVGLLVVGGAAPSDHGPIGAFMRVFYDPPTYLWYLAYLLLFYGLALILRPLHSKLGWLIVPALIVSAIMDDGNWSRMAFLFAFFVLGDLIAQHWGRASSVLRGPLILTVSSLLVVGASLASALGVTVNYRAVWLVNIAAVLVVLLPVAEAATRLRWAGAVTSIGRNSIIYYCTHFVVLMVSYKLLEVAGVDDVLVLALILVPVTLGAGWAATWLQAYRPIRALFAWPALGREVSRPRAVAVS